MELNIKQGQSVKLINNLFNIPAEKEYYKKYKLVHPASLLLNKLKKIKLSLDDILVLKQEIEQNNNIMNFDIRYEKVIFDYIKALDELNDSYLFVIKATTLYNYDYKFYKDVNEWLKINNIENYKKYKSATFQENSFIRLLGDHVKHDDVKVAFLYLENFNHQKIYGFYLYDVIDEDEMHGPNPNIHVEYKNSSTAFSFNNFILKTLGIISYNMFWLNKIIFNKEKLKPYRDNILYELFSKSRTLEKLFFPDEYDKKYLHIVKNRDSLNLRYEKYLGLNNDIVKIENIEWGISVIENKNYAKNKLPYLPLVYNGEI